MQRIILICLQLCAIFSPTAASHPCAPGTKLHQHKNGGGSVSDGVDLDDSVFVARDAFVCGGRVTGRVWIRDLAVIYGGDIKGPLKKHLLTIEGRAAIYGGRIHVNRNNLRGYTIGGDVKIYGGTIKNTTIEGSIVMTAGDVKNSYLTNKSYIQHVEKFVIAGAELENVNWMLTLKKPLYLADNTRIIYDRKSACIQDPLGHYSYNNDHTVVVYDSLIDVPNDEYFYFRNGQKHVNTSPGRIMLMQNGELQPVLRTIAREMKKSPAINAPKPSDVAKRTKEQIRDYLGSKRGGNQSVEEFISTYPGLTSLFRFDVIQGHGQ